MYKLRDSLEDNLMKYCEFANALLMMLQNSHPAILEYILSHRNIGKFDIRIQLCSNVGLINNLDDSCCNYIRQFNYETNKNLYNEIYSMISFERFLIEATDYSSIENLSDAKYDRFMCNTINKYLTNCINNIIYIEKLCNNSNDEITKFICDNFDLLESYCAIYTDNIIDYKMNDIRDVVLLNLCHNPCDYAIDYLYKNSQKLSNTNWNTLCENPNEKIINLLIENIDKLDRACWNTLCRNTNIKIINFVLDNVSDYDLDHYTNMCMNTNTKMLKIVSKNVHKLNKICYKNLCSNPNKLALEIVSRNIRKINNDNCWHALSLNSNPNKYNILLSNCNDLTIQADLHFKNKAHKKAYTMIEHIQDNENKNKPIEPALLRMIRSNDNNYFEYLLNNLDKLTEKCWLELWKNPNIFTYDYDEMKNIRNKLVNVQNLNNIRLKKALYYETKYKYNMISDDYI